VSTVDLCDPVEAYVRPIRSVLFIDDQFPTYEQSAPQETAEVERARALWKACVDQGWLCDIDNSASWDSDEGRRRLASCDLLVLDYHLIGNDSVPALSIIRDLARSVTPNLVVLYTKDPQLNDVLLTAASWARGMRIDPPVPEALEDLEDSIEWTMAERVAFLSDSGDWKSSLRAACEQAGISMPDDEACAALLERKLRRDYHVEESPEIRRIEGIGHIEHRWFQCGNLFLVVAGKPMDLAPAAEAEAFVEILKGAVRDWNPQWLACLMAHSRRRVEAGAFRDDVLVLDETLQRGLLGYISGPVDPPEQARRATEIATHLLSERSADAATSLGGLLLARATADQRKTLEQLDLLHLNAFLCSERFSHHHLHVGTIFVLRTADPQYWVCVTPACDMVPRQPQEEINPWAFELDKFKPMMALRLRPLPQGSDKWKKALKDAHMGRNLFFWDRTANGDQPLVAACFKDTADPNPWLEQMLAIDRATVQDDGFVQLYRLVVKKDEGVPTDAPGLEFINCKPVAQIRAPYAERVVQVVGGHVSRIGVDFVPFRTQS
jgi:hypothetical protein